MPTRQSNQMTVGPSPQLQTLQSLGFLVAILVGLGFAFGFVTVALDDEPGLPVAQSQERINPNEAPPASLVRLPGIGLTRARAIVAYRDRAAAQPGHPLVFTSPDDLQQVKGIGPAIVEGVRPWLGFDLAATDAASSR